jgi:succinyl-CoA synthetase alpha subunit
VALELGLHVMLFSDNVTVEDEVALKRLAVARGLLLMGPDCGTAIINGKPLGFANQVRRGHIGIVGASGTGIQEVTCLIDALGGGISQAIGTGGRDLQDPRIGGLMTLQGLDALAADPLTEVLVIIAKPPHPMVAKTVLRHLQSFDKPAVVHFLGKLPGRARGRVQFAASLVQTAELAVACSRSAEGMVPPWAAQLDMATLARREASRMAPQQRFLRGLYTGGTLADEALFLLDDKIGPVYSNIQVSPQRVLTDPQRSRGHSVVDLGDDSFTRGRPHPMLEPALRAARIRQEGEDPELGLLLLDVVLGYGAHDDPAGAMLAAIGEVRTAATARGGHLPVLASITGTPADPQNRQAQQEKLQQAGCLVLSSNYHAVQAALAIAQEAWGGSQAARAAKRGRQS